MGQEKCFYLWNEPNRKNSFPTEKGVAEKMIQKPRKTFSFLSFTVDQENIYFGGVIAQKSYFNTLNLMIWIMRISYEFYGKVQRKVLHMLSKLLFKPWSDGYINFKPRKYRNNFTVREKLLHFWYNCPAHVKSKFSEPNSHSRSTSKKVTTLQADENALFLCSSWLKLGILSSGSPGLVK